MIDTHTHLNFPELAGNIEAVLGRSRQAGVSKWIVPATDLETSLSSLSLAREYSNIYACVGIHPCSAKEYSPEVKEKLIGLVEGKNLITSIGEVGLDCYHFEGLDEREIEVVKAQQIVVFSEMLNLANTHVLPLIIHSREAYFDTKKMLAQYPQVRAVIHCFTGTKEESIGWLDQGCLLSLTGIITYKKNSALREVIKQIPLTSIMLETDSPYLAPEGHRKEVCEPRFVRQVAECVAEIHGISIEEVDSVTTETAQSFFNL